MARDNATLMARIEIEDCCYLYRDKTAFKLLDAGGAPSTDVRLAGYTLPPGKTKIDEFIGKTEVFENGFEMLLPVTGLGGADRDLQLKVLYQGCSEKGVAICYPPTTKIFDVQFRGGVLSAVDTSILPPSGPGSSATRDMKTFVLAVIVAFGAGLLLTFTPCVLPMVPILSSIIIGQGDAQLSKLRGGLLSYSYVLGTAATYTAAGILAGYSGDQLQSYFQNPWAIGTFAVLLGLLALSLFGFYELQMPSFIQSRLHQHTQHRQGRFVHRRVHSRDRLGADYRRLRFAGVDLGAGRGHRRQGPGARRRHHVLAGARAGRDPGGARRRRRLPAAQGRPSGWTASSTCSARC